MASPMHRSQRHDSGTPPVELQVSSYRLARCHLCTLTAATNRMIVYNAASLCDIQFHFSSWIEEAWLPISDVVAQTAFLQSYSS